MGSDPQDSSNNSKEPGSGSQRYKGIAAVVFLLALVLVVAWVASRGWNARFLFIALGLACVALAVGSAISYRYRVLATGDDIIPATVTMNVVIFLCVGLVTVSVYTATPPHNWTASIIWSLAAVLLGGAVGFLFGIPRSRTGKSSVMMSSPPDSTNDPQPEAPAEAVTPAVPPAVTSTPQVLSPGDETAIEQISDWLTKIIVGIGLINIRELPGQLKTLGRFVATSIDPNGPINVGLGLGIMIYFSILGVITGYLLTQIFLLNLVNRRS